MYKIDLNEGCEMAVNSVQEQNFLLDALTPDMTVLEVGAGLSTFLIAKRVKKVISIEHNKEWFDEINKTKPQNVELYHIPQNSEPKPEYSDGTYEDFKDYCDFILGIPELFDVVFIDGRARVDAAKFAAKCLKENGVIFIHDFGHPDTKYRRTEYDCVLDFLELDGQELTMAKFVPKGIKKVEKVIKKVTQKTNKKKVNNKKR
jgi:SAM-dependent methyltransferase